MVRALIAAIAACCWSVSADAQIVLTFDATVARARDEAADLAQSLPGKV
jgi:hypothetical protein